MKNFNLVLYRHGKHQELFDEIVEVIEKVENGIGPEDKDLIDKAFYCVHELLDYSFRYGFAGNIFHNFIAFIVVHNENAFSLKCELSGEPTEAIREAAIDDFRVIKYLIDYDIEEIDRKLGIKCFSKLVNHEIVRDKSKVFNERIRDCIYMMGLMLEETENAEECYETVKNFYNQHGVGDLGLHKAYRLKDDMEKGKPIVTQINPITSVDHIRFDDLVGYELQKDKLRANTEAFLNGKPANNVLLFGDAGTGKSSSVKALLNEYFEKGLRVVEVYKHQFPLLLDLIEQLKDRNYKFIIFMDDLSFEEYEIEYKYLKAIIEGGIAKKPGNVLIYATSNRRHLVREKWSDKDEQHEDLHTSDTVQEKLSLAARFGLQIYFGSPAKKEYEKIVLSLAEKAGIIMNESELLLEANKWQVSHAGTSGRVATQFINHMQRHM